MTKGQKLKLGIGRCFDIFCFQSHNRANFFYSSTSNNEKAKEATLSD
jgi:hypothetical protein